jgi:hypothetical protein
MITPWEREINHIATGRALSPGGELLPPHHGSQQRREDGGGVDGDGSGGNSLSRQGAETEISVPQNLSSMPAALRNFSWMEASSFRVFRRGQYIGERARLVGARGAHTIGLHGQRWARATLWCGCLRLVSVSPLDSVFTSEK